MKRMAMGLLVAFTVVGCAQVGHWSKPGAPAQDFGRDDFECRKASTTSGYQAYRYGNVAGVDPVTRLDKDLMISCMRSRGWTLDAVTYE